MLNGTHYLECLVNDQRQQQQQQQEIVYIALTLFVNSLSALSRFAPATRTLVVDALFDGENMTLPLRHPFTALVTGPTGCGKTRFVFKLIENARATIDPPPRRVVYCAANISSCFPSIRE